jgi:hypothetical protein
MPLHPKQLKKKETCHRRKSGMELGSKKGTISDLKIEESWNK